MVDALPDPIVLAEALAVADSGVLGKPGEVLASVVRACQNSHAGLLEALEDAGVQLEAAKQRQRIQWSDREMDRLRAEMDALQADHDWLRGLATALADTLDEIDNHPSYKAAWGIAYAHGAIYSGPNWVEPLDALRAALEARHD